MSDDNIVRVSTDGVFIHEGPATHIEEGVPSPNSNNSTFLTYEVESNFNESLHIQK